MSRFITTSPSRFRNYIPVQKLRHGSELRHGLETTSLFKNYLTFQKLRHSSENTSRFRNYVTVEKLRHGWDNFLPQTLLWFKWHMPHSLYLWNGDLSSSVRATYYYCIQNVLLLAVCVRTPRRSVIYYILLAAIGGVSGVFAYYPHPGGQAYIAESWPSIVYFRRVKINLVYKAFSWVRTPYKTEVVAACGWHMWYELNEYTFFLVFSYSYRQRWWDGLKCWWVRGCWTSRREWCWTRWGHWRYLAVHVVSSHSWLQ